MEMGHEPPQVRAKRPSDAIALGLLLDDAMYASNHQVTALALDVRPPRLRQELGVT